MRYGQPKRLHTTLYDEIGTGYSRVRLADPRVVTLLSDQLALPAEALVADIGAGTAKYAHALAKQGLRCIAVDPSAVMLKQSAASPRVKPVLGVAEALPISDASVDGVMCILAAHHFRDFDRAVLEMERIRRGGCTVFLTVDWRLAEPYWFNEYFPETMEVNLRRGMPLHRFVEKLASLSGRPVSTVAIPVPRDFTDLFCGAPWSRPELYLSPDFRACVSTFAAIPKAAVDGGVHRLAQDLASGAFSKRYVQFLDRNEVDLGLRVVTIAER